MGEDVMRVTRDLWRNCFDVSAHSEF